MNVVAMGEVEKFLGFITAILYSFLPVLSSGSPSRLPDVSCSGPLKACPLVYEFPKELFRMLLYARVFPTFLDFVAYIFTLAASLEVPFAPCRCHFVTPTLRIASITRRGILIKSFARVVPAAIISLIFPFAPSRAVSGSTEFVPGKSA